MRIAALSAEIVDTLLYLEEEKHLVGIPSYIKEKKLSTLPKISWFQKVDIKTLLSLKPDLVVGYSYIQKEIAKELIEKGIPVFIGNHQTLWGIFKYVGYIASLLGVKEKGELLKKKMWDILKKNHKIFPSYRVYFEEWDDPMIAGVRWVSELLSWMGLRDIFHTRSKNYLAKDRVVKKEEVIAKDPEVVFLCWCGKKAKKEAFQERFPSLSATRKDRIYPIENPLYFLSPSPSLIFQGIETIKKLLTPSK